MLLAATTPIKNEATFTNRKTFIEDRETSTEKLQICYRVLFCFPNGVSFTVELVFTS